MLRINKIEVPGNGVTLRLEGRVVGPWVTELRRACDQVLQDRRPLRLQLTDVDYLDVSGLELLGDLRAHGIPLLNPPPFVAEQLKPADGEGPR